LAEKPRIAVQSEQLASDHGLGGTEPDPARNRTAETPPLETEPPAQASEEITRPEFHKPAQRSLVFGFLAILAVLGILMLIRFLDWQEAAKPAAQTPAIEKAQPAADAARPTAAAVHPIKASDPEATEAVSAQNQTAGVEPQASGIPDPAPIDYEVALTRDMLSPYNQDPDRVKRVQKSLKADGYDTGPIDGIIGPQTTSALQQFAGDHHIGAGRLFAPDLASAVLIYTEVAATHPDWYQIMRTDDFTRWLDSQSHYRADRNQSLKEMTTARQVNEIIEMYKLERNEQPD
jgi:hypothetical protein